MSKRLFSPWVAFGLGTLLALGASVFVGLDRVAFGDAEAYLAPARAIFHGQPYPRISPVGDHLFRAPGYPLLIAATWHLVPNSVAAVKAANAIAFGLLCAAVWAIFPVLHVAHGTGFAAGLLRYLRNPDWSPPELLPPRAQGEGTAEVAPRGAAGAAG